MTIPLPPVPGPEITPRNMLSAPWHSWFNQLYTYLTQPATGGGGIVSANRRINTTAPLAGGGNLANDLTLSITANGITNALLAQMPGSTIKGNNSGGVATPLDLSTAQVTAMLNVFGAALQGLVPPSGGGTTTLLRADGSWANRITGDFTAADLILSKSPTASITASAVGGALSLAAAAGSGSGTGGALSVSAGTGGAIGPGGALTIASGNAGGGNASGGQLQFSAGFGLGSGSGGTFLLQAGAGGSTGAGGGVTIAAGSGVGGANFAGQLVIPGPPGSGGTAGDLLLFASGGADAAHSGNLNLQDFAGNNTIQITPAGAINLNDIAGVISPLVATRTRAATSIAAYKPSDTTATSSALTADATLQLTFNETGKYALEIWLPFYEASVGTGGFQFDLGTGTATVANLVMGVNGFSTAALSNAGVTSTTTATSASTVATSSSAPSWFLVKGSLSITGTGTLGVRWAQASTLLADPTTLKAGAYFTATKIAA